MVPALANVHAEDSGGGVLDIAPSSPRGDLLEILG
jgi:hypothetical protein